jgi:hypothetical protein
LFKDGKSNDPPPKPRHKKPSPIQRLPPMPHTNLKPPKSPMRGNAPPPDAKQRIPLMRVMSRRQKLLNAGNWCEYLRLRNQIKAKATTNSISSLSSSFAFDSSPTNNYVQGVLNYDDVEYVGNVSIFGWDREVKFYNGFLLFCKCFGGEKALRYFFTFK